jgi:hypothetical protein
VAWTSPPTFSSGNVLSAAQLNVLSDNQEFLFGYVSGQNPGIASLVLLTDGDGFGVIRHEQRYLHVVYLCQDDIKIYYDATEVFHDGAPDGVVNDSAIIDLNPFSFTVGQLYTVKFTMDSGTVFYFYESDSAV